MCVSESAKGKKTKTNLDRLPQARPDERGFGSVSAESCMIGSFFYFESAISISSPLGFC